MREGFIDWMYTGCLVRSGRRERKLRQGWLKVCRRDGRKGGWEIFKPVIITNCKVR